LRELALSRFFDPATGAIREYFDDAWQVSPRRGEGSVEPGHLFEWASLLRLYESYSGERQDAPIAALTGLALRHGLDPASGRIVDEIGENGVLRKASSRCWPHMEALKALGEDPYKDQKRDAIMASILNRVFDVFCRPELKGGWIDRVDAQDRSLSDFMPASTLYHVYFSIASLDRLAVFRTKS
jgi:mannose/cellobiose epimerase-like protein (N-acyl-D-glucosamine 2-epimerase family)